MGSAANIFVLTTLQKLLADLSQQALEMDAVTAQRFTSLAGQVVEIRSLQPDLVWHLTLRSKRIDLGVGAASDPNVAISGTPLALLQTLLTGSSREPTTVDGDATILLQLRELASSFAPDLVKPLENLVGKETAQRGAALLELGVASISEVLGGAQKTAHEATKNFLSDRYSTETEVEEFFSRIDRLRLRVDRLQAKLDLTTKAANPS